MIKKPLTIVNFKTYLVATGAKGEKMAKALAKAAKSMNKELVIAVQAADVSRISKHVKVFAQHIDCACYGKFTGLITAESVKQAGAIGTLLNHSEHGISLDAIQASVKDARDAGLIVVICADTPQKAAEVAKFKPDFVAIEPPELIASKTSVSEAEPEIITRTIEKVKVPVLAGAGVNKKEDVKVAQKLGTKGILVANAVVNGKNPSNVLKQLLSGYK